MARADPPRSDSVHDNGAPADHTQDKDDFWRQVIVGAATAAGSVAWISAIGSGIMALRLGNADLPIEPVVALMSPEHRFAVGAGILAGPLLAGFFAALVDWFVCTRRATDGREIDTKDRQYLAVLTILLSAPFGYGLLRPPPLIFAAQVAAVVVTVTIALAHLHVERHISGRVIPPVAPHSFRERVIVFLAVLVSVGAVSVAAERIGPTRFDAASITVTDSADPVEGGYITSTDYAVLVMPTDADCPMIKAVPRDQIVRIEVSDTDADTPEC
jgi:hypothetical protein